MEYRMEYRKRTALPPKIFLENRVSEKDFEARRCRGIDVNIFFPNRDTPENNFINGNDQQGFTKRIATAKAICEKCTIKDECLRVARINKEKYGVFGGKFLGY